MGTSIASLAPISDTDANFRLWGKAISDALVALGLVKTSDTGQIDWATVLKPAAGSTSAGFEIWRLNDALQSSAPFFIKIEYGSGSAATTPSIWITIGTTTNGAGTLGGNVSTRTQIRANGSSATLTNCYFSGQSSRINFALWPMSSNNGIFVSIERLKDAAGADTSEGVYFLNGNTFNGYSAQTVGSVGIVSNAESPICAGTLSGTTAVLGTEVGTFPIYPARNKMYPPCLGGIGYISADITAITPFPLTVYGVSRTYLPLGAVGIAASPIRQNANGALAMPYS